MNKHIKIELIDPNFNNTPLYADNGYLFKENLYPQLYKGECKNILKKAKKIKITTDELAKAIIAEMYKRKACSIIIDIDELEKHID